MRMLSLWLVLCLAGALPAVAIPLLPNDILVTGTGLVGEGLIRIDRDSGSQTMISPGSYGDFQIVGQTVYALSGPSVVVIDTASGLVETIASGGLITAGATGIAVLDNGDVFVASDEGVIVRIDATSHQQSIHVSRAELDAAFGLPNFGSAPIRDLEMTAGGSPISLANYTATNSWVAEVSLSPGQMMVLFDARDLPFGQVDDWGVSATGLGIASDGLIVASDGGPNTTAIAAYDPTTDMASIIGGTVIGLPGGSAIELILTDVAIDALGVRWIVGNSAASPIDGLWRNWRAEGDGTAFSPGIFNEIQIVPIPEPASGALILLGLALLAGGDRLRRLA